MEEMLEMIIWVQFGIYKKLVKILFFFLLMIFGWDVYVYDCKFVFFFFQVGFLNVDGYYDSLF